MKVKIDIRDDGINETQLHHVNDFTGTVLGNLNAKVIVYIALVLKDVSCRKLSN
jgi:hypothetical protein